MKTVCDMQEIQKTTCSLPTSYLNSQRVLLFLRRVSYIVTSSSVQKLYNNCIRLTKILSKTKSEFVVAHVELFDASIE